MFDWLWPVLASLDLSAWTLVYALAVVVTVLLVDVAMELCFDGCYRVRRAWRTFRVRRELHREDRRHADPFHIDRKIAGELYRLAHRTEPSSSRAGAGRVSTAVGSLPDTDAARGGALLAELAGHPHQASKLDLETDYARGTTLYAFPTQTHRVRPEPWLAGRDLV